MFRKPRSSIRNLTRSRYFLLVVRSRSRRARSDSKKSTISSKLFLSVNASKRQFAVCWACWIFCKFNRHESTLRPACNNFSFIIGEVGEHVDNSKHAGGGRRGAEEVNANLSRLIWLLTRNIMGRKWPRRMGTVRRGYWANVLPREKGEMSVRSRLNTLRQNVTSTHFFSRAVYLSSCKILPSLPRGTARRIRRQARERVIDTGKEGQGRGCVHFIRDSTRVTSGFCIFLFFYFFYLTKYKLHNLFFNSHDEKISRRSFRWNVSTF